MFNLSEKNLIIGLAHPVHFQFRKLSLKYLVSLYSQSLVNTRVRGLSASCPFPWIFKNVMSVSASVSAISNYFLSMSADKDGQRCPQIDLSLSTCVCTTPVSSDFVVEKTTIFSQFLTFDSYGNLFQVILLFNLNFPDFEFGRTYTINTICLLNFFKVEKT